MDIVRKLIDKAVQHGFDAVKFQKRTVGVVYSQKELDQPRESPFGTTNGDLKRGLELDEGQYREIDECCRKKGIQWLCSPWDEASAEFLEQFDPICYKIASACLTDEALLTHVASKGRPVILSTGMSTQAEVDRAVEILRSVPLVLLHTTSTYPSKDHELSLATINTLRSRYGLPVGYSGHEVGVLPSVLAASAFGACVVERHITLDRAMWGSDQAASLEPAGMERLVKYIRMWPVVKGDGIKRVFESEVPVKQKLRRVG
jgi:N-acetylneuraminate synthase